MNQWDSRLKVEPMTKVWRSRGDFAECARQDEERRKAGTQDQFLAELDAAADRASADPLLQRDPGWGTPVWQKRQARRRWGGR